MISVILFSMETNNDDVSLYYPISHHTHPPSPHLLTISTQDFSITLVYTILWFISSCAWADQVGKIKHYTDPSNLFLENPANKAILPECLYGTAHCYVDLSEEASYANLNFSIVSWDGWIRGYIKWLVKMLGLAHCVYFTRVLWNLVVLRVFLGT